MALYNIIDTAATHPVACVFHLHGIAFVQDTGQVMWLKGDWWNSQMYQFSGVTEGHL